MKRNHLLFVVMFLSLFLSGCEQAYRWSSFFTSSETETESTESSDPFFEQQRKDGNGADETTLSETASLPESSEENALPEEFSLEDSLSASMTGKVSPPTPEESTPTPAEPSGEPAPAVLETPVAEEHVYTPGPSLFNSLTSPESHSPTPAGAPSVSSPQLGTDTGYITLIDDIEVPAEEAGVLVEFGVKEGSSVKKGDLLAKIDDDQVRMAVRVADAKLKSAQRQASNDVNIRYARAASQVAYAEILQAQEANEKTPNTVPQSEVRRYLLAHKQAELQIEQATHEFTVAKYAVEVQQAELEAAQLGLDKRKIDAPVDGTVVERFKNVGEWVKPGDPLLRLIRMDVVRVKFLLDAKTIPVSQVRGRTVQVTVPILPGKTFSGKVTFISPLIESGTRYQVWAEIPNQQENGYWILQPGMQVLPQIQ